MRSVAGERSTLPGFPPIEASIPTKGRRRGDYEADPIQPVESKSLSGEKGRRYLHKVVDSIPLGSQNSHTQAGFDLRTASPGVAETGMGGTVCCVSRVWVFAVV